jgi:hypothetical protein
MFTPKGHTFLRGVIAKTVVGGDPETLINFAADRWAGGNWSAIAKAAVGAEFASDLRANEAAAEYFDFVLPGAIIGKMTQIRKVDFNQPIMVSSSTTRGYWTSQASDIPISKRILTPQYLAPLSVSAITVHSDLALKTNNKNSEESFAREHARALAEAMDLSFIDPSNAGIAGEEPASITYGVTPITATSDPAADIVNLIEDFQGDLLSSYFITDPVAAAKLSLSRDSDGSFYFPDVNVRGGSILGIPVIVSRVSPKDSSGSQLALVDASGLAMAAESLMMEKSDNAAILMADDPSGPAEMVSMWQTNCVAFLTKVATNWKAIRPGSVSLITGINY